MISRQSHIPVVAAQIASTRPMIGSSRSPIGGRGLQADRFAQDIAGKYGFGRSGRFGRLELIFRTLKEMEAAPVRIRGAAPIYHQWFLQIQIVLQQMKEAQQLWVRREREQTYRWEKWLRYAEADKLDSVRRHGDAGLPANGQVYTSLLRMAWTLLGTGPAVPREGGRVLSEADGRQGPAAKEIIRLASLPARLAGARLQQEPQVRHHQMDPAEQGIFTKLEQGRLGQELTPYRLEFNLTRALLALQGNRLGMQLGLPEHSFIERWLERSLGYSLVRPQVVVRTIAGQTGRFRSTNGANAVRKDGYPFTEYVNFEHDKGWADQWGQTSAGSFSPRQERFAAFAQGHPASILFTYNPYFNWIRSNNVSYGESFKDQRTPVAGANESRFSGLGFRTALSGFSLPTIQRFRWDLLGHTPGSGRGSSPLNRRLWPSIGLFYRAAQALVSQNSDAAAIQRNAVLAVQRSWNAEQARLAREWMRLVIEGHPPADGRLGEQKEGALAPPQSPGSFIFERERGGRQAQRQPAAGAGAISFEQAVPHVGSPLQRRLRESGLNAWSPGPWPELPNHAGRTGGRFASEPAVFLPVHLWAPFWGGRQESAVDAVGSRHRMEGRLRFEAALSLRARPLGAAWEVLQEFLGSRENALARYLLQGKISDQAAANSGQAFVVPSRPVAALLWRMPTTYSLNMERFIEGIMNRPVTNGSPVDSLARPGVSVPMLQRTLEALAAARLGMGHSAASAAHMPVQRAAQRGGSAATMWGQAQTPWLVASLGPAYMDAGGTFFLAERPSYPRWNALYSVQGLPAGQLAAKGSYLGSPSMPVEEQTPISPPIWRWGRQMGLWQHREVPNLGWNIPFIGLSPAGGGSLLRAVTLTQLQRSPGKEALWLYLAELEAAGAVTGGLTSSIRQSSAQHEGRSRISHQQQPYPDPSYGPAKERKAFLLNVLELNRPPSRGSWLSRFQRTDGEWNGWSDFEQAGSRARGEAETRKAQANANLYISLRGLRLQNRLDQPFNGSLPREPGRLWRLHPAEALEAMNPKGTATAALGWRRLRDEGVEADRAAGQTGRPRPGVDYGGLTGSSPRTVQLHRQGPHVRKGIDSSALAAITDYITRLSRSIGLLSPRIHAGHIAAMNTGRDSDGNGNRRMAEVKAPLLQEVFRAWNGMNFPNAAKGWSHWGAGTEWIPVTPDSWNSRSLRNVHAAKMSDFGYLWSTWRDRSQGNALNSMHAMGFWNPWDTARNVRQDSGSGAEAWKVHAIRMTNGLIDLRQPAFRLWQERLSTQLLNLQPFGNRNDGSFRLSMTGEAGMNSQIREIWLTNRTAIYPDGRTNGQRGSEQVFGSRVSPAFDAILREAIIPLRQAGLAGSTATAGWPTNPYLPGLQYLRPAASFGVPGDWMQKTVYGFRHSMDANAEADRQLPVSAALSAYDRAVRTSLAQAANWLSSAIGQAAADSQIVSPSISGLRFPLAQEPKGTGGWSGSLQRAALIFHGQSLPAAAETLGTLRKVIQAGGSGPLQEAQRLRQTSSPEKRAGVQRFIVWLQPAARQPIGTAVMGIDPGSHGRQGALPSTEDRHLIASGVNTVFVHMMLKRMQPEAQRSGATSSLTGSGLEHRAGHQDVLEHKRTPSVTPEESEWAQTPLDISWLKPAPAQAPAAAAVPAIQPAPQIELSQLEELIKDLPQLDIRKIADKVYQEIEKKMRFERQRRGL